MPHSSHSADKKVLREKDLEIEEEYVKFKKIPRKKKEPSEEKKGKYNG
jgi:hypothetical protein